MSELKTIDKENNIVNEVDTEKNDKDESQNDETKTEKQSVWKDLEGDKMHVLVLFFLYILQGIPFGLNNSVPLELSKRNVPYKEQATFSLSGYPFSLTLLWAPLVDSIYWPAFGRRKSWLVPVQYLIGELSCNMIQLQICNDEGPHKFT